MNINWVVDSAFSKLPRGDVDALAVSVDGTASMSYAQLRERRNRFANLLLQAGVKHGDRVGMVMLNCLDSLPLYLAITLIGAIGVRINVRLAAPEFAHVLADAGCETVIFHASKSESLSTIRGASNVKRWWCLPDAGASSPAWAKELVLDQASATTPAVTPTSGDDIAVILYTSGTTGRPKGSVWTHQNSLWAAAVQAISWQYKPQTVALSLGPMHHVMGMEVMILSALLVHGTAVLMSTGSMSLERLLDTARRTRATDIWAPPFVLYELARLADDDPQLQGLDNLRLIMSGGDVVQPWAVQAVQRKLPGVGIQPGYGLTEGGSIVTMLDPTLALTHADCVGSPLPLTDVQVMHDDGSEADVGEVGQIWVRSPAVSGKYWNQPAESQATFADGWCRTGDLGRVTSDGQLALTGRYKDMIRSGAENIYPAEVEAVLSACPGIAAVAVIAVPDARYLEVGCAVVKLTGNGSDVLAAEQSLRLAAESSLARYKCPKHYVFVNEMPLTPSGKILKRDLRERFVHLGSVPLQASSSAEAPYGRA